MRYLKINENKESKLWKTVNFPGDYMDKITHWNFIKRKFEIRNYMYYMWNAI